MVACLACGAMVYGPPLGVDCRVLNDRNAMSAQMAELARRDHKRRKIVVLAYFLEGRVMAWNVKGTYLETCSCEFVCPCNFSFAHGADYDRCRVTLVFNVTEGNVEGTDVGGLVVAVIADTPKVMAQGNWRLGVFVDDKASTSRPRSCWGFSAGSSADRWPHWGR